VPSENYPPPGSDGIPEIRPPLLPQVQAQEGELSEARTGLETSRGRFKDATAKHAELKKREEALRKQREVRTGAVRDRLKKKMMVVMVDDDDDDDDDCSGGGGGGSGSDGGDDDGMMMMMIG
jgi:hypothetical protein